MFLYLVSSSINLSIFHITWLDNSWTDIIYYKLDKVHIFIICILNCRYINICIIKEEVEHVLYPKESGIQKNYKNNDMIELISMI